MSRPHLHIIGGGIAGLACAVAARQLGAEVTLYEASPQFGGRCRSFHDPVLDRVIDGGSHLMLTANHALLSYARTIGGAGSLQIGEARFPFYDLDRQRHWALHPNRGILPWWLLFPARRCPDGGLIDHLALLRACWPGQTQTVAQQHGGSSLYSRLLSPLTEAILNTKAEQASAALLASVLRQTLLRGGTACRPVFASQGLSAALIDPAVAWLRQQGCRLHTSQPIKRIEWTADGEVAALDCPAGRIALGAGERCVLAAPPAVVTRLLRADMPVRPTQRIVSAHFRLPPGRYPPLLGLTGGLGQWIFCRQDVASVTISAADRLDETALPVLWAEVRAALGLGAQYERLPAARLFNHHQATLLQDPACAQMKKASAQYPIILAGDSWHPTLPCTLEAAVLSGQDAARRALCGR